MWTVELFSDFSRLYKASTRTLFNIYCHLTYCKHSTFTKLYIVSAQYDVCLL